MTRVPHRPTPHLDRFRALTCIVVGITAIGACGGSDEQTSSPTAEVATTAQSVETSSPTTSPDVATTIVDTTAALDTTTIPTTSPTSTEPPVPTTVPDTAPVDTASEQLATAFTLLPADFSEPWVEYQPPTATDGAFDECSIREGGAVTRLTNGAAQRGAIMQFGEEAGYVSSIALAFPDEATALEYIGLVNTDAFAQCTLEQLQQFMDANSPDTEITLDATTAENVGTDGFERYIRMAGSVDDELTYLNELAVYRLGRVVVRVTSEYGPMTQETRDQLDDDAYTALTNAYNRVNGMN